MQLTRIDRWLKEKFVYEIHILTLRPVEYLPRGIRTIDLPEKPGRRYKHLYTTSNAKMAQVLLTDLKENNQMFSTKVVDKDDWWVQFIAPEGKSATWYVVSVFILMGLATPFVVWIRGLLSDPEFIKNAKESLEILKG
ncbi:hypothetical protein [Luteolibacter sp. AS25]|uniref:hypothetical protein n=1 Tax=Luteolibacter sp. AS25 TaxID=3135776 RepID=UPI00398B2B93